MHPELPRQVAGGSQRLADTTEGIRHHVVDIGLEAVKFGGQQPHHLPMHFVLGAAEQFLDPPQHILADVVDDVAESVATDRLGWDDIFPIDTGDGFETTQDRVDGVVDHVADVHPVAVTRHSIVGGEAQHLLVPSTLVLIEEDEIVAAGERLLPGGQRRLRIPTELGVGPLHQVERVVVEAEEHVQTMLFDALVLLDVATARGLATQSPSRRVHGDLVTGTQLFCGGEFERRGDGSGATTEDSNTRGRSCHRCPNLPRVAALGDTSAAAASASARHVTVTV